MVRCPKAGPKRGAKTEGVPVTEEGKGREISEKGEKLGLALGLAKGIYGERPEGRAEAYEESRRCSGTKTGKPEPPRPGALGKGMGSRPCSRTSDQLKGGNQPLVFGRYDMFKYGKPVVKQGQLHY